MSGCLSPFYCTFLLLSLLPGIVLRVSNPSELRTVTAPARPSHGEVCARTSLGAVQASKSSALLPSVKILNINGLVISRGNRGLRQSLPAANAEQQQQPCLMRSFLLPVPDGFPGGCQHSHSAFS